MAPARLLFRFLSQHLHIHPVWLIGLLATLELCFIVLAIAAVITLPIAYVTVKVLDFYSPDEYQKHESTH